ncbi:hypothetical protein AAFC00_004331 [Neodothiora populina]|uniref:HTH CENPB-type domain-containing protein n=1 Tax=Neodothiora populina TaxID=2781224 RepID=A0ABR3PJD3_9PEZI
MPPYLIGVEQSSLNPFSASNTKRCMTVRKHQDSEGAPHVTCWEILTVRLGHYAKEQSDEGVAITDEMLQKQARLILYDDPDPWNQTAADNPEWLDLFKRAHGLDYIPNELGAEGKNVPEDLELYSDLGIPIPFSIQLAQQKTEEEPGSSANVLEQARDRMVAAKVWSGPYPDAKEKMTGFGPTRKETPRYSSLTIPFERAKQFETVPDPYPASGVRGQVRYTKDMIDPSAPQEEMSQAEMLCFLGLSGAHVSNEDSASSSRTHSTVDIAQDFSQWSIDQTTLQSFAAAAHKDLTSATTVSQSLQALNNVLASAAATELGPDPTLRQDVPLLANARCCNDSACHYHPARTTSTSTSNTTPSSLSSFNQSKSQHRNQVLQHLGFSPWNIDPSGSTTTTTTSTDTDMFHGANTADAAGFINMSDPAMTTATKPPSQTALDTHLFGGGGGDATDAQSLSHMFAHANLSGGLAKPATTIVEATTTTATAAAAIPSSSSAVAAIGSGGRNDIDMADFDFNDLCFDDINFDSAAATSATADFDQSLFF